MSRLSGSIRLVSEKPPIVAPSEKAVDNLFAFNKGTKITANNGYEVILRPEVHGFDIKIKNPNVIDKNNYAVRAAGLKLPKTGNYFVTFNAYASSLVRAKIAADINDTQSNKNPIDIKNTFQKYFGVYIDINPDKYKNQGIDGGFIDFNITDKIFIEGFIIHIENVMIGTGDKEAPFSRPIEDIVANALNGIDSPSVVPRRFLATTNVFYKNGKEVDANDGVAYLDFIIPTDVDYREANMYMCLKPTKFNVEPTKAIIEQSGKFKLVHRKAIEQIDTLISNTIDTSNLSAQRVIFKSGNTVKGVVTGTPGSSITSDGSVGKDGASKYYMWLGSDVPESAPFSIDVDGNVKIGGKASFQRTSVDVISNITIDTNTKDSLFNVISTDNNYITIKINGGDYTNKEFEFTSLSNVSNLGNGGFQLEAGDGIEFIHGDNTSKLIYVNYIGKSVRLRHIKTNIYGTIKNYLVVMNAGEFTYDIVETQGMIVSKPIRYAGTKYEISISIKDKDFFYKDSSKRAITDSRNNIFNNTNINDDIKRLTPTNPILVADVPITVTVKEYSPNDVLSRTITKTIADSDYIQVYFLGGNSASEVSKVLINLRLNNLSDTDRYLDHIFGVMGFSNSIALIWDKYANSTISDAWAFPLGRPNMSRQQDYDTHSLIIVPKYDMSKRENGGTDETNVVVFNGTLYIRY